MTVSSETAKVKYTGDGTTTTFPVPFYFLADAHLKVVILAANVETILTLNTDYTVSGAGNPAGGSITTTIAYGIYAQITIARNVPFTQETDYQPNDPFPAASHEEALDKLTMETQQLNEELSRSLTLPISATASTELPMPEANSVIAWNPTGDALENIALSEIVNTSVAGYARADLFSGTGSQTVFTLTSNPGSQANLDVSISGVTQKPGIDYTWTSGTTITFTTAPPSGTNNILVRYTIALASATTQGIADNLAGGDMGYIPYQSGPDVTSFLGPQTDGYVLTTHGAGNPPTWNPLQGRASRAGTALGSSFMRPLSDMHGDYVSVLDFVDSSAFADNNYDWTSAIQAAVDSLATGGGVVHFPNRPLWYRIDGTINVTTNGIVIDGGNQVFQWYTDNTMFNVTEGNFTIKNMRIYNNSSVVYSPLSFFVDTGINVGMLRVEDITCLECGSAIRAKGNYFRITNCQFENITHDGYGVLISATGGGDGIGWITASTFSGNGYYARATNTIKSGFNYKIICNQVQGTVANPAALPASSTLGYGYIATSNNHLYVWKQITPSSTVWHDYGEVTGTVGTYGSASNFISYGAASNTVGTTFVANHNGTGDTTSGVVQQLLRPRGCVFAEDGGAVQITSCELMQAQVALWLQPMAGSAAIGAYMCSNTFFDSFDTAGVWFDNTLSSGVEFQRNVFTGNWMSNGTGTTGYPQGIGFRVNDNTTIKGLLIDACEFFGNNDGITIGDNCNIDSLSISGCVISGSQNGVTSNSDIRIGSNNEHFTIDNCFAGSYGGFYSSTNGIFIDPGCVDFIVSNSEVNNMVVDNSSYFTIQGCNFRTLLNITSGCNNHVITGNKITGYTDGNSIRTVTGNNIVSGTGKNSDMGYAMPTDVSASRVVGGSYQNTTNHPMLVTASIKSTTGSGGITDYLVVLVGSANPPVYAVGDTVVVQGPGGTINNEVCHQLTFIVPPSKYYRIYNTASRLSIVTAWVEYT